MDMKSKKMTYMLICCVVAIWGIIFYRVFAATAAEDVRILKPDIKKEAYFNAVNHASDSVRIVLGYADPFSDRYVKNDSIGQAAISASPVVHAVAKPLPLPSVWSGIRMVAKIQSSLNKRTTVIFEVKGKEIMLSEGGSEGGMKMVRCVGDSVLVEYEHAKKFFSIN